MSRRLIVTRASGPIRELVDVADAIEWRPDAHKFIAREQAYITALETGCNDESEHLCVCDALEIVRRCGAAAENLYRRSGHRDARRPAKRGAASRLVSRVLHTVYI